MNYGLVNPFTKPSCNGTPRESDPQAAAVAPGASERMVASPARNGCGLFAPCGADEKTPASRTARVWCRGWVCVFLEEAKPASVMPGARVEGRFVLSVVAMTGLTCVRRKRLLGRNLITLFECVNCFAKLFSSLAGLRRRAGCVQSPRAGVRESRRITRCVSVVLKNAAFHALSCGRNRHSTASPSDVGELKVEPRDACCGINGHANKAAGTL